MAQGGLKIIEGLKKGKDMPPVFFFYGDSCLIEEAVQDIKAKALSPSFRDMNYHSFDAKEADVDDIISIAQTFPVMSQKRLVIVSRAEALSKSQQGTILSYIKNPAPTTCLVFIADKIDKRLAFFSELDKANYLFYLKPLSDAELPSWIKKEVGEFGKKITDDAIGTILEVVGSELMDIKQEIDKLALFVGERKSIGKEDVEMAVTSGRVDTVFDLAGSIGRKDLKKAIISLRRLTLQKEEPVKILGMITRQFRIIWRAKALNKKGAVINSIASVVGTPSIYVEGYLKQGKGFSDERLLRIFQMLHNADIALKSGRQRPHMTMERLVMELCYKG